MSAFVKCPDCGQSFPDDYKGQHVLPDATGLCGTPSESAARIASLTAALAAAREERNELQQELDSRRGQRTEMRLAHAVALSAALSAANGQAAAMREALQVVLARVDNLNPGETVDTIINPALASGAGSALLARLKAAEAVCEAARDCVHAVGLIRPGTALAALRTPHVVLADALATYDALAPKGTPE